ncbi:MAG: metallophosphoesterase [Sphingomonas sp.]|nr:metallophosphoesterase [Sphingomonas sp.]
MPEGTVAARLKRMVRIAVQAFAVLSMILISPAQAQRPQRIIAVGDLHGDLNAWLTIAKAAGVMGPDGHWTGGTTTLVQLGDIADRGPGTLAIIQSLQLLQQEAPKTKGNVIVVLGNHEAMNLVGDNRYTTPGEYAAFVDDRSVARREREYEANRKKLEAAARAVNPNVKPSEVLDQFIARTPLGFIEHRAAWRPSGWIGKWASANPAIVKIGSVLFAHGGISAEYSKLSPEEVNNRIAAAMRRADDSPNSILTDPLGPMWYRGLVTNDPDSQAERAAMKPPSVALPPDQELDEVLAAYGAKHLVIGHTPSLKGIQLLGNGKLARIDTGISSYYGGPLSWLEIVGDRMIPHTVPRTP